MRKGSLGRVTTWLRAPRAHRHPLREVGRTRRGNREDHDRPPGGAQRSVPDDHRDLRRARGRTRRHDDRRRDPHREGDDAFCSGGDQRVRGDSGYRTRRRAAGGALHVTDLHVQIRRLPKPVVAMVAGWRSAAATCWRSCATRRSPTTPASARWPARRSWTGLRSGTAANLVGPKRAGDLVSLSAVHRRAGTRDGLSRGRPAEDLGRRRSRGAGDACCHPRCAR